MATELDPRIYRLRTGQDFLAKKTALLNRMPDAGVGSDDEKALLAGIDLFDELDTQIRAELKWKGCIHGEGKNLSIGCPPTAIARCLHCASRKKKAPAVRESAGS